MKSSGVPLIDRVLGGLCEGLPLVVTGPSGAGRTVLSLQLAAAALERGEPVAMLFAEPPGLLLRQAAGLGLELDAAVADGRLTLLELDPRAASAVRIHGGQAFLAAVREEVGAPALLIVESVAQITGELLDEALLRELLGGLFALVTESGGVPVVTLESRDLDDSALHRALKDLCGSHIHLDRGPDGQRLLSVAKSRAQTPVVGTVAVEIGEGGFRGEFEPVERRAGDRRGTGRRQAAAPPARRERAALLVVEDAAMDRERVREILSDSYELAFAENGFDAVARILSDPPDVILLDLVMPRVSGWEVLRSLQGAASQIPILVTSGHLERAADRVRALILGAADVLAKPLNPFELRHKVQTLLALPRGAGSLADVRGAEDLLGGVAGLRSLDEAGFRERLERTVRFGSDHQLESTLLAVEARSAESLDRFVSVADGQLRSDDAIWLATDTRALLLLMLTPTPSSRCVLERLGTGFARVEVSRSDFAVRCVSADGARLADVKTLFDELGPWPAPDAGAEAE